MTIDGNGTLQQVLSISLSKPSFPLSSIYIARLWEGAEGMWHCHLDSPVTVTGSDSRGL